MTTHAFQVTLHRSTSEPIDGGRVVFEDRDYETFSEADALAAILPGGDGGEHLDLSLPGFVRWRGTLVPATEFQALTVTLAAKSRG